MKVKFTKDREEGWNPATRGRMKKHSGSNSDDELDEGGSSEV